MPGPGRGSAFLAAQAEALDQLGVARGILALEVVQQITALVDHADKTTSGVVILLVGFKVAAKLLDVCGEQCNLYFRGSGVAFGALVFADDSALRSTFNAMSISLV
jgi:hypothetical protein